jgi:hypothetical protein
LAKQHSYLRTQTTIRTLDCNYMMFPENWPSDVRYLTDIDWVDTQPEHKKHFKEELPCKYCVSQGRS